MEGEGTIFLSLVEDLRIDQITVTAATLCVHLTSTQIASRCPLCDQASTQIYSRYRRTVADVPCGSQPVRLLLDVRKFFVVPPPANAKSLPSVFPLLFSHRRG